MKEILAKLVALVEETQVAKNVYNEKTKKAEVTIEAQAKIEHQLKAEALILKDREAKVGVIEITSATKAKLQEDIARVAKETTDLEEAKTTFKALKQEEEAKLQALREDGDMQQESLNKQKEQLAIDRENYKAEVLKEVAKETKE